MTPTITYQGKNYRIVDRGPSKQAFGGPAASRYVLEKHSIDQFGVDAWVFEAMWMDGLGPLALPQCFLVDLCEFLEKIQAP
jgi:hypothetical protein